MRTCVIETFTLKPTNINQLLRVEYISIHSIKQVLAIFRSLHISGVTGNYFTGTLGKNSYVVKLEDFSDILLSYIMKSVKEGYNENSKADKNNTRRSRR